MKRIRAWFASLFRRRDRLGEVLDALRARDVEEFEGLGLKVTFRARGQEAAKLEVVSVREQRPEDTAAQVADRLRSILGRRST